MVTNGPGKFGHINRVAVHVLNINKWGRVKFDDLRNDITNVSQSQILKLATCFSGRLVYFLKLF